MKNKKDIDGFTLITQKAMSIVKSKSVVLPSSYRVVFSTLAKKYNVDIGAEHIRSDEEISDEVFNHILTLDANASRAIEAIEENDKRKLNDILEETKKLKQELEKLKHEAYEDSLTKTLNRKWLIKNYFEDESETFKKDGVLVIVDLNDFKTINDTFGHAIGDQVLATVADKLKSIKGDVIRYGGDEFLILLDDKHDVIQTQNIIHTLRELFLKKHFTTTGKNFKASFAYGISEFNSGKEFKEVLEKADKKLYEDKEKIKLRLATHS